MSITDRDRKLLLVIVPLVLIAAYWFLLLAPEREAAAQAGAQLAKAEQRLQAAESLLQQKQRAKTSFASDYSDMVRLGKAIPTSVDMPSLIVQLDSAARGTHIRFRKIATAPQTQGAPAAGAAGRSAPAGAGAGPQPAAAGGQPAQSASGKAAEAAGNAGAAANASGAQASGIEPKDTQTSASARQGLPVGGGTPASTVGAQAPACAPGLVCVPLTMEFTGGFFDLSDFFHRLKRFVRVADRSLQVSGRLMTIGSLKFTSDPQSFPSLKAEIGATVYLAPKAEGNTAGATPAGPAQAAPGGADQAAGASSQTTQSDTAAAGTAAPTP